MPGITDHDPGTGDHDQRNTHSLGIMYETGAGAVENKAKAVKWYRRAAEQGNADAQFSLDIMRQR